MDDASRAMREKASPLPDSAALQAKRLSLRPTDTATIAAMNHSLSETLRAVTEGVAERRRMLLDNWDGVRPDPPLLDHWVHWASQRHSSPMSRMVSAGTPGSRSRPTDSRTD